MSTAAKISIQIDAQTATLQKGFGEAKAAIQKLDAGMSGNVAMGMAKFNAGLAIVQGALATVQGAISSVLGAMDEMGKMDEFASRLGMSADALTVLGYAAEQTGASQDTMNMGLQKMQNLIGEAAAGSATAAQSFAALGLSVSDLKNLTPDQQFAAISEQIKNVGSNSERTKIILDIFGKSGGELTNMLALGAEGLNAYGQEASAMGLLMGDARSGVEGAGDSINKMKRAWGAFVQQVAVLVAPALAAIAEGLAAVVGWFNRLMGNATGATAPFKEFSTDAKKAAFDIKDMAAAAKEAEDARKKLMEQGADVTKSMRTPVEVYRDALAELNNLVQKGVITWTTYTRAAKKAMQDVLATRKEISDFKTPAIGAVTRGSASGFSALQEAQRAKQDADRRHRESVAWYARIEAAINGSAVTISSVNI